MRLTFPVLLFFLIVILCALAVLPARGDHCAGVAARSTYVAPVAVPSYGHAAVAAYQPTFAAIVSPDYYYSSAGYFENKALSQTLGIISQQQQSQQAFQQQMLQLLAAGGGQRVLPTQQPQAQPGASPQPQPCADSPQAQQTSYGPVPAGFQQLVDRRCVWCHDGAPDAADPTKSQRLNLSHYEALPGEVRWYCYGMVSSGRMPKGRQALAPAEVAGFLAAAQMTVTK